MIAMPTLTVKFTNVGREKKCWEAKLPAPCNKGLIIRELKRSGALRSIHSISIQFDPLLLSGTIYVGMIRMVGKFEIIDVINPIKIAG